MIDLRGLVGACFLLAIIGTVVCAPIGWAIVIGIEWAYPEILKGQPAQQQTELVQKKILPRTTYEQSRYKIEAKQE